MSLPAARIQETRAIQPRQKFEGHTVSVSGVTHLPGGQQIITCSYDGSLRLWNLESGVQIGNDWQDGESPVISIALSPDGKIIASGSGDGAVRLWDIDTGKVIAKWTGHAGSVKSLCWRRDGGQVASASFDGTARVWDVESGESILGPIKIGFDADVVIYSPDSTMIATGVVTFPKKEYVKIWNANTGELVTSLREHRYTVTCLAWTPDGRTLISGSLGNSIRTWNTTTWEQMAVLKGHTSSIHAIVVSPNGCIFASASLDGTARLWNIEDGQPIGSPLQHANLVSSLSFSADGHLLATGCADKNAYLWDIAEIVRAPGPNKLHLNATDGDSGDANIIQGADQQLENTYRVPPGILHDSPHHPESQPSGRRSPALPSAFQHHASGHTFLGHISSLFRRTNRKDSNLRSIPSSQTEEILTPTDNEGDAPLCSTCSALDIRAILHDGVPQTRALPLGHLTDILNKHNQCGLCRLIAFVIRRNWRLDEKPEIDIAEITCALYAEEITVLNVGDRGDPRTSGSAPPARRDLCHRLRIQPFHRPREVTTAIIAAQSSLLLEIQLLEEDASKVGRTKELHGRRVGQTVDIGLLKRWIHICENEHQEKCETMWWKGPEDVLPKCVRVLDVTRMAIVPAPRSCRYVALSYIWGGPGKDYWTTQANLKQRSRRGGLDISVLPVTICDTIQLVRQLGERYLWIDALCIVQDDHKDKEDQICVMDLVYGNSVFTIFAAGGSSVREPLPGIRPDTRDPNQQIAKIQGLHLAVPLVLPRAAVVSSEWNTRGWTYQELMLSRRRIFFTSHHLHFECAYDVFGEDVVADLQINSHWISHPLRHSGAGQLMTGVVRRGDGGYGDRYMTMVGEYTLRKLTVEHDIVNAMTALINTMTKGYQWAGGDPTKAFRFGMPLGDLEHALVWQPAANASHERRVLADGNITAWPSWSWAAWRGAVRYNGYFIENVFGGEELSISPGIRESLVEQWHIVDDDGKLVRQDVRRNRRMGEEAHRALYVPPKGDIDARQLIRQNLPLRPGTLVFRTSSARFNVTKANDLICANVGAHFAIYSIMSDIPRPSTRVGRVVLPCFTPSPTSCEFVVLSRTTGCAGLFDEDILDEYGIWKRLGYDGCMFYVMAVQKMWGEERMERLGVGVILDRAWLHSTAEQKVVLLG